MITKEQLNAGLQMVMAIAEAIRELKEVPEGHLYTNVMSTIDLSQFNKILDILEKQKLITRNNYLIKWVEPS